MDKCIIKKAIAECFGTFVLVFFAVGTALMTNADVVATALAFGLVIVAMAFTIGRISGCHINPAVSLGALLAKRLSLKDFFVYVLAQFVGAILGAILLYGVVRMVGPINANTLTWGTNSFITENYWGTGNVFASLILEIVLTFVFVYVILAVTSKKGSPKIAGLLIGLTLTLVHLVGIGSTGTSVNPARSFGPALARVMFGGGVSALEQYFVFLIAPMIGGALSAFAFKYFHKEEENELKEATLTEAPSEKEEE